VVENRTNLSAGVPATSMVTTDYLYDADGNRLIEHTTDSADENSWADGQIAVRTAASPAWQLTDRNNTANASIDATTQTATWRYTDRS